MDRQDWIEGVKYCHICLKAEDEDPAEDAFEDNMCLGCRVDMWADKRLNTYRAG